MSELSCPRCGFAVKAVRGEQPSECPRCLARSGGILSVTLEAPGTATKPHGILARLVGRGLRGAEGS